MTGNARFHDWVDVALDPLGAFAAITALRAELDRAEARAAEVKRRFVRDRPWDSCDIDVLSIQYYGPSIARILNAVVSGELVPPATECPFGDDCDLTVAYMAGAASKENASMMTRDAAFREGVGAAARCIDGYILAYSARDELEGTLRVVRDAVSRLVPQADPVREAANRARRDVMVERKRQIEAEGWTPEHDDAHDDYELARAATCYAAVAGADDDTRLLITDAQAPYGIWPWDMEWWKPTDRRRDLVKAGALILAEIERLDRRARAAMADKGGE